MAAPKGFVPPNKKSIDSFWSYVDKSGDGCWPWTAGYSGPGYGVFHSKGTHRVAYELAYGEIPVGKLICHKCDNPACCRPDHLFVGTHKDNSQDMTKKGRARGLNSGKTICKYGHEFTP